jgi:multidrug resistance efflux pump
MSQVEAKQEPKARRSDREPASPAHPFISGGAPTRKRRIVPVLLTTLLVVIAALFGRAMWNVYMGAPWTRDGKVRAYVVTMAPEVFGRIVKLPISDNQHVHKGELLMVIDPTNYRIAVSQARAAVLQAQANLENIDAQLVVHQAQIGVTRAQVDQAQAALVFSKQQAGRYGKLAQEGWGTVQDAQQYSSQLNQQNAAVETASQNLALAQRQVASLKAQQLGAEASLEQGKAELQQALVNLRRTRILSPVDGYVTNLLAQVGDYANVGVNVISLVDADSYWVDGYFEETNVASIRVGDPAEIKLMGYGHILRGRVDSVAREINDANAQPNGQGIAVVNPIFTWVRLAQRIPVRIHIDRLPAGVTLVAGMTATVQIDARDNRV